MMLNLFKENVRDVGSIRTQIYELTVLIIAMDTALVGVLT
jgi:hypothetical protein